MGRWDDGVWNPSVPLPPGIRIPKLQVALEGTERAIDLINRVFADNNLNPLFEIAQSNNFSGIVSNILTDQVSRVTPYSGGSERRGPDLFSRKYNASLEVKTTLRLGKGGEGHNGHGGWHVVGCFRVDPDSGAVRFVHVMVADLVKFDVAPDDWAPVRETKHSGGSTGHSATYSTTLKGTAKLRDGTVYRDTAVLTDRKLKAWVRSRRQVLSALPVPAYSPFYVSLGPTRLLAQAAPSSDA
jgi:hypothetical protein